jgi:signal transduction histidine kinase
VLEELRSDFVATVSHELRTPLAAVYGAALTLQRDDLPLDEMQRGNLMDVIATESERLARTVNDILWASKLDAERLQLEVGSHDPSELAQTVIRAARVHLPPTVSLSLSCERELPPVAGDPDKVRQVLTNLVDNAIKYSPQGGRVDVRVSRRDHAVLFSVADQGLGIPQSERRRIFDKFYRVDPNLSRGVGGTGLGLYICRELVRRMNGTISVESREGEGSTFSFELPVATA